MTQKILTKSYIFLVGVLVILFAVFGIVSLDTNTALANTVLASMLNGIGLSSVVLSTDIWVWTIIWFVLITVCYGKAIYMPLAFERMGEKGEKYSKILLPGIGGTLLLYVILGMIFSSSIGMFMYTWVRVLLLLVIGAVLIVLISVLLKAVQIFIDFLVKTVKLVVALFLSPERKEALKDDKVYSRAGLIKKHSLRYGIILLLFLMSLYILALKDNFLDFSGVPAIFCLPISTWFVSLFGVANIGILADSWNLVIMIVVILALFYAQSYFKPVVLYTKILENKDSTKEKKNIFVQLISDIGVLVIIALVVFGIFSLFGLTSGLAVDKLVSGSSDILANSASAIGIWALAFVLLLLLVFIVFWIIYFCINIAPKLFRKMAISMAKVARDAGEAIVSNSVDQKVSGTIVVSENARIIRKGISVPTANDQETENSGDDEMNNSKLDNSIFPTLTSMDIAMEEYAVREMVSEDEISLEEMTTKFRAYLATVHHMYFDIKMIRAFVAGFGASRLLILEGVSGTGKSSLPRLFSEFIGGNAQFVPVQSTWRDRIDLLGYYNDFTGTFKETDFLQSLYKANYETDKLSIAVLDEANLSRMEYYFADFISILEFPEDDWKLNLINEVRGNKLPAKLQTGDITIPVNQFFVATANKDDSTYSITERVYDRAIVISFDDRNKKVDTEVVDKPIFWSTDYLRAQFESAQADEKNSLTDAEIAKFDKIIDYCGDALDITIGNRIYKQMNKFVSAYVACGGNKEEAIDYILSSKIIRKVSGRYDDSIFANLTKLATLITKSYKKGMFTRTLSSIERLQKKL